MLCSFNCFYNFFFFLQERYPGDVERYNDIIRDETIRVAVCGMVENECYLHIPKPLVEMMQKSFLEFFDYYEATCKKKMNLDGQIMKVKFFICCL